MQFLGDIHYFTTCSFISKLAWCCRCCSINAKFPILALLHRSRHRHQHFLGQFIFKWPKLSFLQSRMGKKYIYWPDTLSKNVCRPHLAPLVLCTHTHAQTHPNSHMHTHTHPHTHTHTHTGTHTLTNATKPTHAQTHSHPYLLCVIISVVCKIKQRNS